MYRRKKKWKTEYLITKDLTNLDGSIKKLLKENEEVVDVKMTEDSEENYTVLVFIAMHDKGD